MNIYLAGKMRGVPEFNYPAFHAAAAKLREAGHTVFSPAEHDIEAFGVDPGKGNPTGDESQFARQVGLTEMQLRRKVFGVDLGWITQHADAVALLTGWEDSSGARAEHATAVALGLKIMYL
jgi:hypothetical protein